jgi:hypothetical protein
MKPFEAEIEEIAAKCKQAYGDDGLRRLNRTVVETARIEPGDAEFLVLTGVPCVEQLEISFNLADKLPRLRDLLPGINCPKRFDEIFCLNEKYKIVVGIDNGRGGVVTCLDLKGKIGESFVNSRVRYLVGFMSEWVLHWKRYTERVMPEAQSLQSAWAWMRDVDEAGLNGAWWRGVFEEMRRYQ